MMIFRDINVIRSKVTLSLDQSFNPLILLLHLHVECNQKVGQVGYPFLMKLGINSQDLQNFLF